MAVNCKVVVVSYQLHPNKCIVYLRTCIAYKYKSICIIINIFRKGKETSYTETHIDTI